MYSINKKLLGLLVLGSFLQLAVSFPTAQQPDGDQDLTVIPERKEDELISAPVLEDKADTTWIIDTGGKGTAAPLLDFNERKEVIKTVESPDSTTMTTPTLAADVEDIAESVGITSPMTPKLESKSSTDMEKSVHSEAAEGVDDLENMKDEVIYINARDFDQTPNDSSFEMEDNTEALIEEFLNKCMGVKCVEPPEDVECKEDPVDYPPPPMAGMTNDCCPVHYCRRADGSTFFHYAVIFEDAPPTHIKNTPQEQKKRSFVLLDDDSPFDKHDESFVLLDDDEIDTPSRNPSQEFPEHSFNLFNEESPFQKHEQERPSYIQTRQQRHEKPAFVASLSITPGYDRNNNGMTSSSSHDGDIPPFISSLLPHILSLFSPPSPQSRQTPSATPPREEQHGSSNALPRRQTPYSGGQAPVASSVVKQASTPSESVVNSQSSLPLFYSMFNPPSEAFPLPRASSSSFQLQTPPAFFQTTHNYPTASANSPLATLTQQVVSDSPPIGLDRIVRNTNTGNSGPSPILMRFFEGPFGVANANELTRPRRDALLDAPFSAGLPFGFLPNRQGVFPFNERAEMEV